MEAVGTDSGGTPGGNAFKPSTANARFVMDGVRSRLGAMNEIEAHGPFAITVGVMGAAGNEDRYNHRVLGVGQKGIRVLRFFHRVFERPRLTPQAEFPRREEMGIHELASVSRREWA